MNGVCAFMNHKLGFNYLISNYNMLDRASKLVDYTLYTIECIKTYQKHLKKYKKVSKNLKKYQNVSKTYKKD